ncbi:MAG: glycosyltransferase family 4 protein [Acidobacteriota bacterium]|nr:MAG: glycosyltransferase family 4 protein [Acidobacteriota bacterium]
MKFLYHHRTQGRGGEGLHIAHLVRALEREGHHVEIVSPPGIDPLASAGQVPVDKVDERAGTHDETAKTRGVSGLWRWVSVHCPQVLFELFELAYNAMAAARLLPALRRNRDAVFYERYAFYLLAGVWLARLFRLPILLEVNEVAGIERARAQRLVPVMRWVERRVFRRADAIFAVSSFLRQRVIAQGVPAERVHVVPNAVEPTWLESAAHGAAVRQRLQLGDGPVAGFVGWFDRWDRLDLIVEVLKELEPQLPELRLILVGSGPAIKEVKARADALGLDGRLVLTGPVPREEVRDYIDAMDICALPDSNPFGSPIVMFEFMAMGKPVVAPDIQPVRDVVRHRENGWIIAKGDRQQLREAIHELATNRQLRRTLGACARQTIATQHTWDANARTVAMKAEQLLATRRE